MFVDTSRCRNCDVQKVKMETASHSGSSNVSRESKTLRTLPTLLQDTHSPQSRMKHFINHWTLATVVTELDLEGGSGLERIWSNLWYQAKSTVSISLRYLPVLNCHSHPDSLHIQTGHRSLNILAIAHQARNDDHPYSSLVEDM